MNTLHHFIKRFSAGLYLGAGWIEKIKAAFGLILISRLPLLTFTLQRFGKRHTVAVRTGSDVATLLEVLYEQEYALPDTFMPKTIVDLGANIGFSSVYFSLRDPSASIVALEPDPQNIPTLHKNLDTLGNCKIIPAAIAANSGTQKMFSITGQGMSSSVVERPSSHGFSVPTYSLNDVLDKQAWSQVDLIKFDIEGAEWDVFTTINLDRVGALIGEFHEDLTGKKVADFIALFPGYTATIKKIHNARYIVFLTK